MNASGGAPTLVGAPVKLIRFPTPEQCICSLELLERCLPARLARRTTRTLLDAFDAFTDQAVDIEEAVAELVANAERYSPKPWRLRIYLNGKALWVGVFDGDTCTAGLLRELLSARADPDPMREHGRGLFLARQACRGECWVRTPGSGSSKGKEVLMRFVTPGTDPLGRSAA